MDSCCSATHHNGPIELLPVETALPPEHDQAPVWVRREEFDSVLEAIEKLQERLNLLDAQLGLKVKEEHLDKGRASRPSKESNSVTQQVSSQMTNQLSSEMSLRIDAPTEHPAREADSPYKVDFGGSVWNLPLILDFRSGLWDVLFSSILLIVNIGMQAMFSTILFSEHFAGAGVDVEEELEHARLWRTSIAHDWRYMDLSETSLASRVCKSDAALILSTPQAELVDHINSFLGLKTGEFKPGFLQPGILLCMLCILHWGLCVYKEFRSIWSTLEAVATIPRSSRTTKSEHYIHSLSFARFIFFFLTCVVRAAIASILLMAGINWLARTSSIEELMLNAVALNGIMDVDELLFAAFTPLSIQHQLQRLRPVKMKYTSGRSQRESVALFFLLLATVLIPYFVLLQPLGDGMLEIKKEMCGGNLTFVVGYNPDVQEVLGYVTQAARSTEEQSLSELAVNQHKFLNQQDMSSTSYIYFTPNRALFEEHRLQSIAELTEKIPFCIERDILSPNGTFYGDPLVLPLVNSRLKSAAIELDVYSSNVQCQDMREQCKRPDARLLRMVCGVTCGCTDPLASPWHKVKAQGCSDVCTSMAVMRMEGACDDRSDSLVWTEFWDGYGTAVSTYYGQDISKTAVWPFASNVSERLRMLGCQGLRVPQLQTELVSKARWCEGFPPLFRPLAWLCPNACGCASAFPDEAGHCPAHCVNTTSVGSAGLG